MSSLDNRKKSRHPECTVFSVSIPFIIHVLLIDHINLVRISLLRVIMSLREKLRKESSLVNGIKFQELMSEINARGLVNVKFITD